MLQDRDKQIHVKFYQIKIKIVPKFFKQREERKKKAITRSNSKRTKKEQSKYINSTMKCKKTSA